MTLDALVSAWTASTVRASAVRPVLFGTGPLPGGAALTRAGLEPAGPVQFLGRTTEAV